MNIPLAIAATTAFFSTSAAAANIAGKLPRIDDNKTKVRVLALASIALTAALYKGVTLASAKAFGNKAVSFISAHKLKATGTLAAAAAAYLFFPTKPTGDEVTDSEG